MAGKAFLCLLVVLIVLISLRLLNGKIVTRGMLSGGSSGGTHAERVQALYMTFAAATFFAARSLHDGQLLDPPPQALWAVGASHGVYLLGKFIRR